MDQAETLAARAAIFGGIMGALLIYWQMGDTGTTTVLGLLVAVAITTWAAYVIGTQAIRRFVPELE